MLLGLSICTLGITQDDDGRDWDGEKGCELCAKESLIGEVEGLGVGNC